MRGTDAARKSTVSLADVARRARVDTSTASRALAGDTRHRMGDATRQRVLSAARKLGYRPNLLARALRTAHSNSLGIIVPQLDNPVYAQMISGAEAAARERGYALLIVHVGEDESGVDAMEQLARTNHVDGLLVSSLDDESMLVPALRRAPVPTVVLNRRAAGIANCVSLDTHRAALQAVNHLLALGHRRIAHLAGRPGGAGTRDRIAGYREALKSAGIRFDPSLVAVGGFTAEGGERAMREVLQVANTRPTAVFVATLLAAAGALKALRTARIAVPEDMSLVTLHDSIIAEVLDPPLTTVRLPTQQMGYEAVCGLVDLIEGRARRINRVLPPQELTVRGSAVPPRT